MGLIPKTQIIYELENCIIRYDFVVGCKTRSCSREIAGYKKELASEGKQPKLSDLDAPTIYLKYMEQKRSWPGLTKQQKPKLNTLTLAPAAFALQAKAHTVYPRPLALTKRRRRRWTSLNLEEEE